MTILVAILIKLEIGWRICANLGPKGTVTFCIPKAFWSFFLACDIVQLFSQFPKAMIHLIFPPFQVIYSIAYLFFFELHVGGVLVEYILFVESNRKGYSMPYTCMRQNLKYLIPQTKTC